MISHTFKSIREDFPEAPAHSVYAVLFVLRVREDEGKDYSVSAALGRYCMASDIIMTPQEDNSFWGLAHFYIMGAQNAN